VRGFRGCIVPEESEQVQQGEDIESITKVLAEEQEKAERYLANWQRTEADFANFKKRTEQEKAEITKFANGTFMMSLLPILDDFERALDNVSPKLVGFTWVDGIRLIYRKLQMILEAQGLSQIVAVGKEFDPALHEAVLEGEGEEGEVIEELQKGYTLHERVLRPAMVKVGKGKEGGQ
jgi:molecular chaperone GrpE